MKTERSLAGIPSGTYYYAVYTSSVSGVTGCVKQFATIACDTLEFPAAVQYDCDICKTRHRFSFNKTYACSTPSQHKFFSSWCDDNKIEQGIPLLPS